MFSAGLAPSACVEFMAGGWSLGGANSDGEDAVPPMIEFGAGAWAGAAGSRLAAGAAFYLQKPLVLEEVRAIIGRLLEPQPRCSH